MYKKNTAKFVYYIQKNVLNLSQRYSTIISGPTSDSFSLTSAQKMWPRNLYKTILRSQNKTILLLLGGIITKWIYPQPVQGKENCYNHCSTQNGRISWGYFWSRDSLEEPESQTGGSPSNLLVLLIPKRLCHVVVVVVIIVYNRYCVLHLVGGRWPRSRRTRRLCTGASGPHPRWSWGGGGHSDRSNR